MKKYGKYETRPEGVPVKQPKVKSALLRTYFISLLCMVLCMTMFFGTSYAWFTSDVENTGNEIYVGTMKVGLYKLKGDTSVSLASSDTNTEKLFSSDIRWEPGYTALETIQVVNEGDLAFKYGMNFTTSDTNVEAVAKNFEVWVFVGEDDPDSYEDMADGDEGWIPVGTLAEVLNGKAVLEDRSMYTVRKDDSDKDADVKNDTPDGVRTVDTYTIALHMKKSASDKSLMGQKINLNVKLVAYQMGSEEDSFGNPSYDDAKYVNTVEELQKALDDAKDKDVIRLASDITGGVTVTQKENVKITIDGNGHEFNGVMTVFGNGRKTTAALTIKNIDFVAANGAKSCIVSPDRTVNNAYSYSSNVTVENCTFTDPDGAVNCAAVRHEDGGDSNWKIVDCVVDNTMHSLIQTNNVELDGLTIQGCKVYSKNGVNLNQCTKVSIIDCEIDVKGYTVRYGVDGATVNGAFEIKDSTLKSANDDGDAVIIFRGTMSGSTLTITNTTLVGTPEIAGDANVVRN